MLITFFLNLISPKLIRKEFDNQIQFYDGERRNEKKIRTEFSDGKIKYYDENERLERTEFSSGNIEYYSFPYPSSSNSYFNI